MKLLGILVDHIEYVDGSTVAVINVFGGCLIGNIRGQFSSQLQHQDKEKVLVRDVEIWRLLSLNPKNTTCLRGSNIIVFKVKNYQIERKSVPTSLCTKIKKFQTFSFINIFVSHSLKLGFRNDLTRSHKKYKSNKMTFPALMPKTQFVSAADAIRNNKRMAPVKA